MTCHLHCYHRVATPLGLVARRDCNSQLTHYTFVYHRVAMSTDKELYKLELLSLVSRVSQELFNHTKLQDKNLAEFVISVRPHSFLV